MDDSKIFISTDSGMIEWEFYDLKGDLRDDKLLSPQKWRTKYGGCKPN